MNQAPFLQSRNKPKLHSDFHEKTIPNSIKNRPNNGQKSATNQPKIHLNGIRERFGNDSGSIRFQEGVFWARSNKHFEAWGATGADFGRFWDP